IHTCLGKELDRLQNGSRVGVMLDATRLLHLLVNGRDQGGITRDVPQPCYPYFHVFDMCRQESCDELFDPRCSDSTCECRGMGIQTEPT
ncbi:hypothetical protein BaRGS_00004373, partial [Batillaria attramentaria]